MALITLASKKLSDWFKRIRVKFGRNAAQQPLNKSTAGDKYRVKQQEAEQQPAVDLCDVQLEVRKHLQKEDIMFSGQQGKVLYKLPGLIGGRAEFIIEDCKVHKLPQ